MHFKDYLAVLGQFPLSLIASICAVYDGNGAQRLPSNQFGEFANYLREIMQNQTRAATLHKGEFLRLIKITRATAKLPERDVLVLMLGHKAGLRITEISRIQTPFRRHSHGLIPQSSLS